MTNACQKDFMLVGNGNAFDSAGVKLREGCRLGQISAYVVSPEAVDAKLQVHRVHPVEPEPVPTARCGCWPTPTRQTKTGGVGIGSSTLASLIPQG